LDPLPERKRAFIIAKTGDVDANDLGRIADLAFGITALHRRRDFVRPDERIERGGRELAEHAHLDPRVVPTVGRDLLAGVLNRDAGRTLRIVWIGSFDSAC
jgi:hypothetical protein